MTTKKILGFIAIAVIGIVAVLALGSKSALLGGIYNTVPQQNANGEKGGAAIENAYAATIAPGANSAKVYCNNTGRDVIAEFGSITIPTGQTASSSLLASMFATSSASIGAWADFGTLAESKRALMQAIPVATSTTASTTNSTLAAAMGKGTGQTLVASGSCVWAYLQQNTTACNIAGAAAGVCETATSTNRGTNPIANVRVHTLTPQATSL